MSELLTTARPYAKALFKSGKNQNLLDQYFDMLKNLNTVLESKDIKNILLNDSFENKYKVSLLTDILKEGSDENFLRFIALLTENNRLQIVSEIVSLYDSYFQEERSLKTAKIDTAFELNSEQLDSIKIVLEKRFNKKIEIEQNLDVSLLAGAVVRIDDLVIDGSFKEQLRKLESQLI
tara:strand:- start:208 stop:741 length:534 start_codon:yes stop_codon:yes gene_type:complete